MRSLGREGWRFWRRSVHSVSGIVEFLCRVWSLGAVGLRFRRVGRRGLLPTAAGGNSRKSRNSRRTDPRRSRGAGRLWGAFAIQLRSAFFQPRMFDAELFAERRQESPAEVVAQFVEVLKVRALGADPTRIGQFERLPGGTFGTHGVVSKLVCGGATSGARPQTRSRQGSQKVAGGRRDRPARVVSATPGNERSVIASRQGCQNRSGKIDGVRPRPRRAS